MQHVADVSPLNVA